ncbi:hypothetical protein [Allocoleopsis sp.]
MVFLADMIISCDRVLQCALCDRTPQKKPPTRMKAGAFLGILVTR